MDKDNYNCECSAFRYESKVIFMDNQQKGEILIYKSETGETKIDVFLENGTVWLSRVSIAQLYGTSPQNITMHVKNIYTDG